MLDQIVAAVERRLPDVIARFDEYRAAAHASSRSFTEALSGPGLSVIAEVKRRSPSRGALNEGLQPGPQARAYESGGASAISVLTERDYFGGSPDDLREVERATSIPVLRKDFTLHPAQVWESAAMGADAVLLIVAVLDDGRLRRLLDEASTAGLAALVEVHSEDEAQRAVAAGAGIIGVNNRDLKTFSVDLGTAERLAASVGDGVLKVAESGINEPADAARMAEAGYDAVLVGESLVRAGDPAGEVARLVAAGR